jgi:MFS family permease
LTKKKRSAITQFTAVPNVSLRFLSPATSPPIVVTTVGYALLQTANNTAVMTDIRPDQRGTVSGMLNLSRNLGLITGASVMGAVFVFAFASATINITTARPETVATGMQITFAVAAILIVVPLAIVVRSRALATSPSLPGDVS